MAAWEDWNEEAANAPWTVGIEEEVMLLDPTSWLPVSRCEDVLACLPADIVDCARAETHGSALELGTAPHATVGGAVGQLAALRTTLAETLEALDVRAAVAGTHPTARWEHIDVSPGARYQYVHASMRELARREPTFGLHVHVAVPGAEQALRALNALRSRLPLLLALSGNSPFWQGRDSGLASARTPAFQVFPRTGLPRRFRDYAEYVEAIDVLLRSHAIPEPTFLWWDARLQPALGTLEVRIMDAQTRVEDTAAIAALVQCLVRTEADAGEEPPEVLSENRFIAARDGMASELMVAPHWQRRPIADILDEVLDACAPAARELDCVAELGHVPPLAALPGATRQREMADRAGSLEGLVAALSEDFAREAAESSLTA